MKITEMNLRNALTEKDSGWVNIPHLSLNQTRLPLLHTHIFSLSILTQVKAPRPGKKRKGLDWTHFSLRKNYLQSQSASKLGVKTRLRKEYFKLSSAVCLRHEER